MSKDRFAWLRVHIGNFIIMKYDETPEGEVDELGPNVILFIPRPNTRDLALHLTALTESELDATEEFFKLLFDLARPTVQERDRVAKDALEKGDDSFTRVYRADPQFIVRKGQESADDQGVLNGPDSLPEGNKPDGSPDGGLLESGPDVATGEQGGHVSQDDESPAD
jgi:hypothetical protein